MLGERIFSSAQPIPLKLHRIPLNVLPLVHPTTVYQRCLQAIFYNNFLLCLAAGVVFIP